MHVAIRVSSIEELSVVNGSIITVVFKPNAGRNSIRFRGDPSDLESVEELLRPTLQEKVDHDLLTTRSPTSPQIVIHGESAILSPRLLEDVMVAMPSRYHFDRWKRLYPRSTICGAFPPISPRRLNSRARQRKKSPAIRSGRRMVRNRTPKTSSPSHERRK